MSRTITGTPDQGKTSAGPSSPWITFAIAAAAVFVVTLDATALIAAFPALREDFAGSSPAAISWTLNAYTILFAALLVPSGRLADLWGRKRLFRVGMSVFTLASLACFVAPGVWSLVIARCAQALGAAALTTSSLALLLAAFPVERRSAVIGLYSAVGAVAAALGPALGSWLIDLLGWRAIFGINVPTGIVVWWIARRALRESTNPGTGARPDLPGIALLTLGVGAMALAIVQSVRWGWAWNSPTGWVLASGLALLVLYARWSRGRQGTALDPDLFGEPQFGWAGVATFVFGVAFTLMFLGGFLFLRDVWGYSQTLAGSATLPGPLMAVPAAIIAGRVAGRVGQRPVLVLGGLLYALSQAWLFWRASPEADYLGIWLPSQLMAGVAVGLILPSLTAAALLPLPATRYGEGGGAINALRQLGGALGAALAVRLVGATDAGLRDFQLAFAILALLGAATTLLSLPMGGKTRAGTPLQALPKEIS